MLQGAIWYLEKAREVDPTYPGCYIIEGKIHLSRHELDKAVIGLSKAIELNPYFFDEYFAVGDAQYLRGLAYYNSLDFKGAWKDLSVAAELGHEEAKRVFWDYFTEEDRYLFDDEFSPSVAPPIEIISLENAQQCYAQAMDLLLQSEESVFKGGKDWRDIEIRQQNLKAIAYIEKALELEPDYPGYHILKGKLQCYLFRTNDAIVSLSRAIELRPDFSDPYFPRGKALFQKGLAYHCDLNHKMARESFTAAANEFDHAQAKLYLELVK